MSDADEDVRSNGSDIRAVDRAAQILALFGPHTPELTAAEAADRLDLNRTTAYRYCTSLVAAGLLERGQTQGSFVPGALLLQLGTFALGRQTVLELAPAHMRELCAVTRLTTVLSLWGSGGPIVSRVEEDSTRTVLVTVRVGTQLNLTSAQAKIFLAHTPDQLRVDRLVGGVSDDRRADLVAEIRGLAGTDRVAMSPDGFGVHAIAAPVFAEHGICAAIALIATDDLLPLDDNSTAATLLRETARALSKAMGAPPRPT